ncbi:MAG: dockerin type I repeat-containing protein, partial [candidate division Zixibacteria bacterium]|nr:dockerin type I repeat-containing protein [candidate division Zixibacteria bacterium]
ILPVPIVSQFTGGDTDGNSTDGNRVADGEYGDYCSGPASAAMAVKYWYNKGYGAIQKESNVALTDAQLMDRLAAAMKVQDNGGTYDAKFVGGLRDYITAHGGAFTVYAEQTPTAQLLLSWAFDNDYLVMAGLSGNSCLWMTVAGLAGPRDDSGRYTVRFIDPTTAAAVECLVKDDAEQLKIWYGSQWAEIDILVGMIPTAWTVARSPVGFDVTGGDGWGVYWNTASLPDDSLYFLTATVNDAGGRNGLGSVLVLNDCTPDYTAGDVNDDGMVNVADLVYLAAFLFTNGPQPPLGLAPADINCDQAVDLADVVYLYRYIFLAGSAPCR